ncbi:charged multivesicular body protein 7 [Camellia sinensis]|uniref:charged multivesicular body protein 7 n=1 Tax=Camellia sinensis TaxID=4442 RepID=UPI001036C890|nr:charged multivesicular body protein 7 [Camellia sinensis]
MVEEGSASLRRIGELIRKEVPDWDDEVMVTARFKAFSGQRSDWEPKYVFWRDLILKLSTHLGVFLFHPSEVKNLWFNRGGLTPLCIDHVLLEMYNAGDILRRGDLVDPTSGRLSQILRRVVHLVGLSRASTQVDIMEDHLILLPVLKDKAAEVVKSISESHWTSSCIITMRKFQDICGGSKEASAILSYLSGCRKVQYLAINKGEFMEGVKVSLLPEAVSSITSLDCDVLHLISTAEKLQQQLHVINQRWEMYRKLALASLQSGNKKVALKHARELKLSSESREKCTTLLNRVEEVLRVIADAESSKKVSEAIQIGARAMKDNRINVEEVQLCLEELEDAIDSQKQVENVLESTSSYTGIEDEDVEDEFKKLELELEVGSDSSQVCISEVGVKSVREEMEDQKIAESISDALSNLNLVDVAPMVSITRQDSTDSTRNNLSKTPKLEAA